MDVNRSRRSARANDVPAVELPLIPMTQPIPPAPQVVEVASVPVVVTIDPKSVAVQDLFRRMAVNKLNIPKDAHPNPELTNCVEGKNVDRWSFDVSRNDGEDTHKTGILLLALAVKLPANADLTTGRKAPWRFKMTRNADNTGPTANATLTNVPGVDLAFDTKIRANMTLGALRDLDPQGIFDEAATMEYLNKVDDKVLHKASQLCYGLIADFDNDNASLGDKALIKGTDGYEKGLKEHIRDARSGDFLVQKCTHT